MQSARELRTKGGGVPTNNHRGWESGPCRLRPGLDKVRHIVQTALLVRVGWVFSIKDFKIIPHRGEFEDLAKTMLLWGALRFCQTPII